MLIDEEVFRTQGAKASVLSVLPRNPTVYPIPSSPVPRNPSKFVGQRSKHQKCHFPRSHNFSSLTALDIRIAYLYKSSYVEVHAHRFCNFFWWNLWRALCRVKMMVANHLLRTGISAARDK
jgi:hypothetical protein